MSAYTKVAWCIDPNLIPNAVECTIPEPVEPFIEREPLLYLTREEIIESRRETLQFTAIIHVTMVEDFHPRSDSEDEFLGTRRGFPDDDSSGSDDYPGYDPGRGSSKPWPKVHHFAPSRDGRPSQPSSGGHSPHGGACFRRVPARGKKAHSMPPICPTNTMRSSWRGRSVAINGAKRSGNTLEPVPPQRADLKGLGQRATLELPRAWDPMQFESEMVVETWARPIKATIQAQDMGCYDEPLDRPGNDTPVLETVSFPTESSPSLSELPPASQPSQQPNTAAIPECNDTTSLSGIPLEELRTPPRAHFVSSQRGQPPSPFERPADEMGFVATVTKPLPIAQLPAPRRRPGRPAPIQPPRRSQRLAKKIRARTPAIVAAQNVLLRKLGITSNEPPVPEHIDQYLQAFSNGLTEEQV